MERRGRDIHDRRVFAAAIDVWRDGIHLWRSYDPATGENLIDWTEREHPDVHSGYDSGLWMAKGVRDVADWPIPTAQSWQPVGSARDMRDLMCVCLAIGQAPAQPLGLDKVMKSGTMAARMWRAERDYIVLTEEADGVTIRAMIGKTEVIDPESGSIEWRAKLERREMVRSDAGEKTLEEGEVAFSASAKASPSVLVKLAKAGFGIAGWPATRKPDTLVWTLAHAPYTLSIEKLDT